MTIWQLYNILIKCYHLKTHNNLKMVNGNKWTSVTVFREKRGCCIRKWLPGTHHCIMRVYSVEGSHRVRVREVLSLLSGGRLKCAASFLLLFSLPGLTVKSSLGINRSQCGQSNNCRGRAWQGIWCQVNKYVGHFQKKQSRKINYHKSWISTPKDVVVSVPSFSKKKEIAFNLLYWHVQIQMIITTCLLVSRQNFSVQHLFFHIISYFCKFK